MINKKIVLTLISIFITVLFVLTFTSALNVLSVDAKPFTRAGQEQQINVIADGNFILDFSSLPSFFTYTTPIYGTNSATFNATLNSMPLTDISEGKVQITAKNTSNLSDVYNFDLTYVKTFCNNGPINDEKMDLDVAIINKGEGEDNEWRVLDRIKVEVKLKNNLNLDLDDVVFELGLYEKGTNKNIIDEMIWISDDEERVEIGGVDEDDSSDEYTFEFKIDPSEIDLNVEDYYLVVKAFPDGKESQYCVDSSSDLKSSDFGPSEYFAEIKIIPESESDKSVIIDTDEVGLITAQCNQEIALNLDLWNIGDENYEDQILVTLYNQELGINKNATILGDLDSGDKKDVSFIFRVPSTASEKSYNLKLDVYYDYSTNSKRYRESSEDSFFVPILVKGNCGISQVSVSSVNLESGGKAGEKTEVKVKIINTGSSNSTYIVNVDDYSDWASNADVDFKTVSLNPGQTQEILASFDVNSDVQTGNYTFNFELVSNGIVVLSQPVKIEIEGKRRINTGNFQDWIVPILIALISLVIIAIIIILIVNSLKSKK